MKTESWRCVSSKRAFFCSAMATLTRRPASRYRSQKWCKTTRCHCRPVLPCQESSIDLRVIPKREREREICSRRASSRIKGWKALVLKIGGWNIKGILGRWDVEIASPRVVGRFSLVKIVQKTFLEESSWGGGVVVRRRYFNLKDYFFDPGSFFRLRRSIFLVEKIERGKEAFEIRNFTMYLSFVYDDGWNFFPRENQNYSFRSNNSV